MRLIDADALMDKYHKTAVWDSWLEINSAPTIDAVPVVRCKDCKHYNTIGCSKGFGWCESMDRGVSDDFYCANGTKMESEGSI